MTSVRERHLEAVRSDGDARWFQSALDRLAGLPADADPRLRSFFDDKNTLTIARAPGRLDVMGGIADYSGATVLQLPLDRSTTAIVQRQAEPRCDVASLRGGRWHFFEMPLATLTTGDLSVAAALAAWFTARPDDHWAAYAIGVVQYCLQGATSWSSPRPGLRVLIESTVPEGKGVSSSAAIEVAVMTAVAASYGVAMSGEEIATACQWVENHIVGAPCGIMDQMTSACGRQGRLLRLHCQPGDIEDFIEIPHGYGFFGVDSGVRHAVTGADYGTVRTAAFMGYRIIAEMAGLRASMNGERVEVDDPTWRGHLANIPPGEFASRFEKHLPERMSGADFLQRYAGITDRVTRVVPDREYPVRVATAHPVYEQKRVLRFATRLAAASSDATAPAELGRLMAASHVSYGRCGLGSDATDVLADRFARVLVGGVFGAKITGGGSGGTVAVFARGDALGEIENVAAAYATATGRQAEVFKASGPGAAETGVLVIER